MALVTPLSQDVAVAKGKTNVSADGESSKDEVDATGKLTSNFSSAGRGTQGVSFSLDTYSEHVN